MKNIIKKWLGIENIKKIEYCRECGSLHLREVMKKIKLNYSAKVDSERGPIYSSGSLDRYYCNKHAPKYDTQSNYHIYDSLFKKYYKNNVEVDKNGKPICTKK